MGNEMVSVHLNFIIHLSALRLQNQQRTTLTSSPVQGSISDGVHMVTVSVSSTPTPCVSFRGRMKWQSWAGVMSTCRMVWCLLRPSGPVERSSSEELRRLLGVSKNTSDNLLLNIFFTKTYLWHTMKHFKNITVLSLFHLLFWHIHRIWSFKMTKIYSVF